MTDPHRRELRNRERRSRRVRRAVLSVVSVAVVAAAVFAVVLAVSPTGHSVLRPANRASSPVASQTMSIDFRPLPEDRVATLPEARYDAVIPGLLPYTAADVPVASHEVYSISSDIPIYDGNGTPVARFAFQNFASRPTVIVPVRVEGEWTLVMTPARHQLPSAAGGDAPAQTAGWVRTNALHPVQALDRRIVVSAGQQTLSIQDFAGNAVQTFAVGVGAPRTPTPTGVTGYLQERYLDPQQGQAEHRIQLTSLHSSAQDEPYLGEDGGLVGMHYFPTHDGSISHGCIRLSAEAAAAVDALPLGTSITILP